RIRIRGTTGLVPRRSHSAVLGLTQVVATRNTETRAARGPYHPYPPVDLEAGRWFARSITATHRAWLGERASSCPIRVRGQSRVAWSARASTRADSHMQARTFPL